jgi:DHA1 family tetracycline resistance protein-like MFS transporter
MPVMIKWIGDFRTLMLGMIAGLVGMVGFAFTGSVTVLIIFLLFASLSDLVPALMTAMASNQADEDRQGMVQGVIASLSSIAAILSPLVMTALFQATVDDRGIYLPGAVFLFAGALLAAMIPLVIRLRGHASV